MQIIRILKPMINKSSLLILGLLILISTLFVPHHAKAWKSDWWVWENPDYIAYYFQYGCSTNTVSAFNTSMADWENAQDKCNFEYDPWTTPRIIFDHINSCSDPWTGLHGKCSTTSSGSPYYWITSATCILNEYYTEGFTPNKRRSVSGHEIGHALGLKHETGAVLLNGSTESRYDTYGVYVPTQDDINGINTIYYWVE